MHAAMMEAPHDETSAWMIMELRKNPLPPETHMQMLSWKEFTRQLVIL
jgi:hypothetical protein